MPAKRLLFVGIVLLVATSCLSLVGYWRMVRFVPAIPEATPAPPDPNGYALARQAIEGFLRRRHSQPDDKKYVQLDDGLPAPWWGSLPVSRLRKEVEPARSMLDSVRHTFSLAWGRPNPVVPFAGYDLDFANGGTREPFVSCAYYFAADARLRRLTGDPDGALSAALDAVEIGCRKCATGGVGTRAIAQGCESAGLTEAVPTLDEASPFALQTALVRARRLRHEWFSTSGTYELERREALARCARDLRETSSQPIWAQLESIEPLARRSPAGFFRIFYHHRFAWKTVLTPRTRMLSELDAYYRSLLREVAAPIRKRRYITPTGSAWVRYYENYRFAAADRGMAPTTELGMLEVALAVRLHRTKHGSLPSRLSEVDRAFLPEVPLDAWDQPIRYRLRDGVPLVYSIGRDGRDNGALVRTGWGEVDYGMGDLVLGQAGEPSSF